MVVNRTSICLNCRILLPRDAPCDRSPRHEVARLDDVEGREAVRRRVWTKPGALPLPFAAKAAVAALGSVGVIILGTAFGPLGALGGAALIGGPLALGRESRARQPRGTATYVRRVPSGPGYTGIVSGDTEIVAPLTGRACVAYVLSLRVESYRVGDIMLADSVTSGFTVDCDDGEQVHVPPGRIRLVSAKERSITDVTDIRRFLKAIDPALIQPGEYGPIPYDKATEAILAHGDRIEAHGGTTNVAMSYRESARNPVMHRVPRVRILDE